MNWGDLWQFPLQASVWGTVAAWAGSMITSLSFAATAFVIWRDHQYRRREHALKLVCWIDGDTYRRQANLVNTSEQPVVRPELILVPKPMRKLRKINDTTSEIQYTPKELERVSLMTSHFKIQTPTSNRTLKAGEDTALTYFALDGITGMYDIVLRFYDASGVQWNRRVPGGSLMSKREIKKFDRRKETLDKQLEIERAKPENQEEGMKALRESQIEDEWRDSLEDKEE